MARAESPLDDDMLILGSVAAFGEDGDHPRIRDRGWFENNRLMADFDRLIAEGFIEPVTTYRLTTAGRTRLGPSRAAFVPHAPLR